MKASCCLYPGSFDPVTLGHMDVIRRAARVFDLVVVGILHNPEKKGCFPVEERLEMLKKACADIPNVQVIAYGGLLAQLTKEMGIRVEEIRRVYLAGAFGNYLEPASACRIGMIPPVLQDRIVPIGNAAGVGAKLCALSREEFLYSQRLAAGTEFLELAGLPRFQKRYIEALDFAQKE